MDAEDIMVQITDGMIKTFVIDAVAHGTHVFGTMLCCWLNLPRRALSSDWQYQLANMIWCEQPLM